MFPTWHIALTALVTAALTAAGMGAWRGRTFSGRTFNGTSAWTPLMLVDVVGVGVAAGLGVLLWRLGANVPTLNDDPIPGVSPADVLSAPLAYVAASVYVRLRGVAGGASDRFVAAPALAAVVALAVNIVTI
jgi:hypothetical protein